MKEPARQYIEWFPSGYVILQVPLLTPEDMVDFKAWIEIVLRGLDRRAMQSKTAPTEPAPSAEE